MIAAGIVAVISLAIATLITQQLNSNIFITDQLAKTDIQRTITTLMEVSDACNNSLAGAQLTTMAPPNPNGTFTALSPVATIKDNNGAVVFTSDSTVENLKIGQMQVNNDSVPPGPNASGIVTLIVPISRVRQVGGPTSFKPITYKAIVSVDASNKILACGSFAAKGVQAFSETATAGISIKTKDIPGTWDLCVLAGYKTESDDSNIYDGCRVFQSTLPGQWTLEVRHYPTESLTCHANCLNF